MKRIILFLGTAALAFAVNTPTAPVYFNPNTGELTQSIQVPSGKSETIEAGGALTINGTTNALLSGNNLGDLASATAAATSLGLGATNTVSFAAINLGGTAGAGFITLPSQSSAPAAPASGNIRIYSDSNNKFAWIGASGYTRSFDGPLTASRTFTLPDASGNVVIDSATQTLTGKSIAASEINSGTLAAGLLPAPTTSALGGVQAITAVTHQWINSISTAGVAALSQPTYSDLSGNGSASITTVGTLTTGAIGSGFTAISGSYLAGPHNFTTQTSNGIVIGAGTSALTTSGWTIPSNVLTGPNGITFTDTGGAVTIAAAGSKTVTITSPSVIGSGTPLQTGNYLSIAGLFSVGSSFSLDNVRDDTIATATASGASYASFDARPQIAGAYTWSHYAGYQVSGGPALGTTETNQYDFYSISGGAGTITNRYGYRVEDFQGSGSVGTQYGIYINNLAAGTTANWGIYQTGGAQNQLSGPTSILNTLAVSGATTFSGSTNTSSVATFTYAQTKIGSATGIGVTGAASTDSALMAYSGGMLWLGTGTTPAANLTGTIFKVVYTTSASSSTIGAFQVGNGTGSTNVAIGGGNVYAGGWITAGGWLTVLSSVGTLPSGNGQGMVGGHSSDGLELIGQGSSFDIALLNKNAVTSASLATGTLNWQFNGTTSASTPLLGGLVVGNGTSGTSVGIGGGNINAGGTLTVGGVTTFQGNVINSGLYEGVNGSATGATFTNTASSGSVTTGMYFPTNTSVAWTVSGSQVLASTSTGTTVAGNLNAGGTIVSGTGITAGTTITTAAGATAAAQPWNLGGIRSGTALVVSTTTGLQVSINGTLYTLAVLSTNP